jgi:hypothetical protein
MDMISLLLVRQVVRIILVNILNILSRMVHHNKVKVKDHHNKAKGR